MSTLKNTCLFYILLLVLLEGSSYTKLQDTAKPVLISCCFTPADDAIFYNFLKILSILSEKRFVINFLFSTDSIQSPLSPPPPPHTPLTPLGNS